MVSQTFRVASRLLDALVLFTPEGLLMTCGVKAILGIITLFHFKGLHLLLEQGARGICSSRLIP